MTDSEPPTEKSAQMSNPLLAERRRAERAESELQALRAAKVAKARQPDQEAFSRRVGRAVTETSSGRITALAGALVLLVGALTPIVLAWVDVAKLRAELGAQTVALQSSDAARSALQASYDASQLEFGRWQDSVDALHTEALGRDAYRDGVICRTGNKPYWRVEWTCPVPARLSQLRE
jgi:hypothetical protein